MSIGSVASDKDMFRQICGMVRMIVTFCLGIGVV